MEDPATEAREHLNTMVDMANRLISESLNTVDPVDEPVRTIQKEDFLNQYMPHSCALSAFMDDDNTPDERDCSAELTEAREGLAKDVAILRTRLERLDELRFWMNTMVFERK